MARQINFFLVTVLFFIISSLCVAQSPVSEQNAKKLIEAIRTSRLGNGERNLQKIQSRFAEVEIVLNDEFELEDISALPRAPRSDLEVFG